MKYSDSLDKGRAFRETLYNTGLFQPYYNDANYLHLRGTRFVFFPRPNSNKYWERIAEGYYTIMEPGIYQIEFVLENVPEAIKKELIFNLDLFR